jgi:DNA repair exonuclease SbcCD nuclease subunit
MPNFLHLADIHLGYNRYNSPQRTQDFYFALEDVIQRYALETQVDFVLLAGDLFEHRNIVPSVLNQAQNCLELLKEARIPVLTIEGNHDNRPYGIKTSWLRYLAERDWLILLEPDEAASEDNLFMPWNPEDKRGGYIDLDCGVRVLGSNWYGASAPQAIRRLAAGLQHIPKNPKINHQVMLFHHGLEGHVARYTGALRYSDLLPLKEAGIDYLAMGHIHKNYEVEGWIFNPGSLEANSIAENQQQNPRGVYLVELTAQGIQAQLKQDYYQRSIVRLTLEVQKHWSEAALEQQAIDLIQAQVGKTQEAIVELRIRGQVGFNRLDLNTRQLQETLHQRSQALVFLLKYEVTGTEYQSPVPQGQLLSRSEIEAIVFKDLLAAHHDYGDRLDVLSTGLATLKEEILAGRSEVALYEQVAQLLTGSGY